MNYIKKLFILCVLLFLCGCENKKEITIQGYIEGTYTYVSSGVSGKLLQLMFYKGSYVKPNQLLFKLDPEPETSQLIQAEQKLAQSQQVLEDIQKGARDTIIKGLVAQRQQVVADLDYSQKLLIRYQTLYKQSVLDKNSLDKAASDNDANKERLKQLDANIAEAKLGGRENLIKAEEANVIGSAALVKASQWAVEQKTIYSPVDARVFDNSYEVGEFVEPGQPVYVLLPRNAIKVIFFVPEQYLSLMHIGKNISFSCDSCSQKYITAISFISPNAEYTPPVIFSKDSRDKLVYRIEALIKPEVSDKFNVGQPVDVQVSLIDESAKTK